jgi:membrane protein
MSGGYERASGQIEEMVQSVKDETRRIAERVNQLGAHHIGADAVAGAQSALRARRWTDILLRVHKNIGRNRIVVIAAGITFYNLLALFPAIAALVAIYGLFADPAAIATHLQGLSGLLPEGAIDVIRDQMNRIAAQGAGALGFTFIVGLAVSLWSANAAIKAIFDALNLVYHEREKRGLVRLHLVSLAFTAGSILFILFAIAALIVVPVVLGYLGLRGEATMLVNILRWPVLLAVVSTAFGLLYRYGASRSSPQRRWITRGSAFAAVAWLAVSLLFSWYAGNFGTYNRTYGSLGAVIGFMMWIWLSTIVILIGAELDAEVDDRAVPDATGGGSLGLLGARNAPMADKIR